MDLKTLNYNLCIMDLYLKSDWRLSSNLETYHFQFFALIGRFVIDL